MIRAYVDKDGRLILPAGWSIDALIGRDIFVLVLAPDGELTAPGGARQSEPLHSRQGVYRHLSDGRDGQSLRFDSGVLIFDAGEEAEVVDAKTIERLIRQEREERLQFPE